MNPPACLVLCAALPLEVKALCQRLGVPCPAQAGGSVEARLSRGGLVRILVSGVGQRRMREALRSLGEDQPVAAWLSVGLAGGLEPDLRAGDCVMGGEVVCGHEGEAVSTPAWLGSGCRRDLLLCVETPVASVEEKAQAHLRTGADAVDMESAAVAQWAAERGEPFGFVRIISDAADEPLDPAVLQCLNRQGMPSAGAAMRLLLKRPRLLPTLIQMGRRSQRCSQRLAVQLLALLEHNPL